MVGILAPLCLNEDYYEHELGKENRTKNRGVLMRCLWLRKNLIFGLFKDKYLIQYA